MSEEERRNLANAIVNGIIADMSDRRGFRQNWDAIDHDIQREIRREWRQIILDEINKADSNP